MNSAENHLKSKRNSTEIQLSKLQRNHERKLFMFCVVLSPEESVESLASIASRESAGRVGDVADRASCPRSEVRRVGDGVAELDAIHRQISFKVSPKKKQTLVRKETVPAYRPQVSFNNNFSTLQPDVGQGRYAKNMSTAEHQPLKLSQADEKFIK